MCRCHGDNFSERVQSAKSAPIFRNTPADGERNDARGKARNSGKNSRLRRRAWINTQSCRKICVMKGAVLFAPTKRCAAKTPCRQKRHEDAFLQKVMGDRAFELWREEGSARFSQSKGSRSNVIGCAAACTNAHARIMRVSANETRRGRRKTARNIAYCSKNAPMREKAFRVFAVMRVCAKTRENAFASAVRRPVTYAHIARTRTLRDSAVLPGQSDATWLKRIFLR